MRNDDDELDVWSLYDLPAEPLSNEAVWTGVRQIIELFSDEPEQAASERADKALEQGDLSGFALWNRIEKAVVELVNRNRNPRAIN